MTAYLLTPHGKDELSAVTVALRRQQEEAQRVLQQTQRDAEKAADAFRLEALEAQKSLSPEERLEVDRARNTRTAKQIAQDDKVERAGRATAAAEVAKAKCVAPPAAHAGLCDAPSRNDDLRRVFEMFDADARGSIDVEELGNLLRELCVPVESEEALGALMEELDLDGSGEIEFPEFTAWYESHAAKMQSGGLRSRFGTAALAVQRMGNVQRRRPVYPVQTQSMQRAKGALGLQYAKRVLSGKCRPT
ncbi:hypothetical protein M885DRAFT_430179 [Pelagophyceae sp. CCMP2097]|nr:hypothetical protein M885DRAFT_430179 [Pelagophyceae sp. CCMP2097]